MGYLNDRKNQLRDPETLNSESLTVEAFPFTITVSMTKGVVNIDTRWVNSKIPAYYSDPNSLVRSTVEPLLAGVMASCLESTTQGLLDTMYQVNIIGDYIQRTVVRSLQELQHKVPVYGVFVEHAKGLVDRFPDAGAVAYDYSWDETYKALGIN